MFPGDALDVRGEDDVLALGPEDVDVVGAAVFFVGWIAGKVSRQKRFY